jgi:DNA modification methylase
MNLPAPFYQDDSCTIYNADCRNILPLLPRFDLLLTDPPYGIGEKWADESVEGWSQCKSGAGRLFSSGEKWDAEPVEMKDIERMMACAVNSIIWGGNYYPMTPSRCWLIWDKMQKHSGSEAEMAWATMELPVRVFRMSRLEAYCGRDKKVHPTQKPLGLIQWCLGFFPNAQTILDPFMGSGTTLVATKLEGRKAVGIEISEKYCELAANRLRQKVLNFEEATR